MAWLVSFFVGKPLNILAPAGLFLAGHFLLRTRGVGAAHKARPLLIAGVTWALYAAWERLVHTKTPEANIRVDLLIIWPVLGLLSAWSLYRSFR